MQIYVLHQKTHFNYTNKHNYVDIEKIEEDMSHVLREIN